MFRRTFSLLALWLTTLCVAIPGAFAATPEQTVLHLLDYIAVEYPRFVQNGQVINAAEYAEQVEFSGQVALTIGNLPERPERSAFVQRANALALSIRAKGDGKSVVDQARTLQADLIKGYQIPVAPRSAPDLSSAESLYRANCAGCHGVKGDGVGPQAGDLSPAPSNFTDRGRQSERSVFGLFNTISLGVNGTAMTPYSHLSAEDRWRLAFYVSRFSASDEQRTTGEKALRSHDIHSVISGLTPLVMMTPLQARTQGGAELEAVLAYLRAHPAEAVEQRTPISIAIERIEQSFQTWKQGDPRQAYEQAVTAYLDGFELAEAEVDRVDPTLRRSTEGALMAYRNALQSGNGVEQSYQHVMALLNEAREKTSQHTASAAANFTSSLIIILREGLEAILVLAAMAAFLVKTGKREGLSWLHSGWIVALILGVLTWIVSSKLISISGAQREVTEGVTALLSAVVLLYVGFWLHSKSNAVKWSAFIKQQITGATSKKTWFGIGVVSFLAVYREVFETVLFYQALWTQSDEGARSAVIGGFAIGMIALVILAWGIIRFSVRLPLGLFFGVSSLFLAAMAVIFAGQGIAAMQAAGKLPAYPIDLPSIPVLGIYPNLQSIGLQIAFVAIIVSGYLFLRGQEKRPNK